MLILTDAVIDADGVVDMLTLLVPLPDCDLDTDADMVCDEDVDMDTLPLMLTEGHTL